VAAVVRQVSHSDFVNEIAIHADACEVDEDRDHIPVVLFQVARSYSKEGHLDQPAADLIVADDNKGSAGLSAIAATTVTTYSNRNTIRALEAIMFNPTQIVIQAFVAPALLVILLLF
jgi:hypothetical protein